MRILFDQAVHDQKNVGNNALLEVAWMRLREFWPHARFDVMSIAPHYCKVYFPGLNSVSPGDLQINNSLETAHKYLPKWLWKLTFEFRDLLDEKAGLALAYGKLGRRANNSFAQLSTEEGIGIESPINDTADQDSGRASEIERLFRDNIAAYDLYVATGGGYMCDSDKRFLLPLFDRMEIAQSCGVLTAMVGQGVGPLEDPQLISRAQEVLPKVDYIFIREEKLTRPLLASLNMPDDKVRMTGDDAIEPAFMSRKESLGTGIGLSLRIAAYTDVNQEHIRAIRSVVLSAARRYGAELVAAPIDANEDDLEYILEVSKGYAKVRKSWKRFESPSEVIERISRCRIMISGTFHGAVFAISQGIPVIALAKSIEYYNKISGLAAEFGEEGCQIISLNDSDFSNQLARAIDFAWDSAERLRPKLLEKAKYQIDLGNAAYHDLRLLVDSRRVG